MRAWVSNEHVNNNRTGSFLKTQNTKWGTNLDVRESKQGGIKCNQKQNTTNRPKLQINKNNTTSNETYPVISPCDYHQYSVTDRHITPVTLFKVKIMLLNFNAKEQYP